MLTGSPRNTPRPRVNQRRKSALGGSLGSEFIPSRSVTLRPRLLTVSIVPPHNSYWSRCIKNFKPAPANRFKETIGLFFEAVNGQAKDRDANQIPDLESFIDLRRDTSACKSTFDMIEYAYDLDLPQHVLEHPVIEALKQSSNDLVSWSNVSFPPCVSHYRTCSRLIFRTSSPTPSKWLVVTLPTASSRLSWNITV